jgi:hypothetical protein
MSEPSRLLERSKKGKKIEKKASNSHEDVGGHRDP